MALRHLLLVLAGFVWLAGAVPLQAQTASPQPPLRAEPRQELLTIATPDGLQLAAQLTLPPNPSAGDPVVILLPDGPGGSLAKATEPARYLARSLAREGFAVLGLETRHATLYPYSRFDEAFTDVRAAIDLAQSRGFPTVILGGTGLGSLLAARYAAAGDGRVRALLLLGPSPDLAAAWRARVGEEVYARTVERATRTPVDTPGFIDLGAGQIFTPGVFLDWYGPDAKTSLSGALAAIDTPVFLAAGATDATAPAARLQRLAQTVAGKKVVTKSYPAAGHDLSGARTALAADIVRWLADSALAPPPHVTMTVVDTRAADGVALSGVLYTPAVAPPAGVRRISFMLVPSFSGDLMRGITHTLATKLAQRGHTALVVRTRGTGFFNTLSGKLDDVPKDLAAWTDVLAARGAGRIIGIGHTMGGLGLSVYLGQTQDKRFRGVAYLSPPRDLPGLARDAMGKEAYERVIAEAQAAVKAGKGASTLITTSIPQASYKDDPRQPMHLPPPGTGSLTAYADAFLSYWGPDALSMHRERIAEMKVPIFAIGGSRDFMMQGGWLLEFIKYAGGLATSIFYGGPTGASGSFEGYEDKAVDDIVGWAQKLP